MKRVILFILLITGFHGFSAPVLTSSNLPIVVVDASERSLNADNEVSAKMKIIYHGENKRNNVSDSEFHYAGYIGIRIRGNSSKSYPQKQYAVETRDAEGKKQDVALLGMPAENDWILYAPYNDISLIRNVFAYNLWNEMGHWAPGTKMVELVLNGSYQGVYVLQESVKTGKDRVNITKLSPGDHAGTDLTGGYLLKIDDAKADDVTFSSKTPGIMQNAMPGGFPTANGGFGGMPGYGMAGGFGSFGSFGTMGMPANKMAGATGGGARISWIVQYPKSKNIAPEQIDYIQDYIGSFEMLMASDKYSDPKNGYAKYIDTQSFVDYFIHTELSMNPDGYKKSSYFYKDRVNPDGTGGKLFAGPVWDFNIAFGNCNFCNANRTDTWVVSGCTTLPIPAFWEKLAKDEAFMSAVRKRYQELRKNALSNQNISKFVDDYAKLLNEAQGRHFQKWNKLFNGQDPTVAAFAAYRVSSYSEEIQTLKRWLTKRVEFMDKAFLTN